MDALVAMMRQRQLVQQITRAFARREIPWEWVNAETKKKVSIYDGTVTLTITGDTVHFNTPRYQERDTEYQRKKDGTINMSRLTARVIELIEQKRARQERSRKMKRIQRANRAAFRKAVPAELLRRLEWDASNRPDCVRVEGKVELQPSVTVAQLQSLAAMYSGFDLVIDKHACLRFDSYNATIAKVAPFLNELYFLIKLDEEGEVAHG